jgi:hypothetical protein
MDSKHEMANIVSDNSKLCDACQHIDFALYFRNECEEVMERKGAISVDLKEDDMPLGMRMEIRNKGSYCEFCSLADTAINNTHIG